MDSSQPVVIDVNQSTRNYYYKHSFRALILFILPLLASAYLAYYVYTSDYASNVAATNHDTLTPLLIVAVPLIIPLVAWAVVRSKMQRLFYTELATSLNCTYTPRVDAPIDSYLYTLGDSQTLRNVLSGTYQASPVRVGDYSYTGGSGKNRSTHFLTLAQITTAGSIPSIFCVPAYWVIIPGSWKPQNYVPLRLEGDFNTKFTVYVPQGKEMEALQILEPDIMLKLMDGFQDFGFECIGNHVYFFRNGVMKENRENVLRVFSFVERFSQILMPELQKFSGTPSA